MSNHESDNAYLIAGRLLNSRKRDKTDYVLLFKRLDNDWFIQMYNDTEDPLTTTYSKLTSTMINNGWQVSLDNVDKVVRTFTGTTSISLNDFLRKAYFEGEVLLRIYQ